MAGQPGAFWDSCFSLCALFCLSQFSCFFISLYLSTHHGANIGARRGSHLTQRLYIVLVEKIPYLILEDDSIPFLVLKNFRTLIWYRVLCFISYLTFSSLLSLKLSEKTIKSPPKFHETFFNNKRNEDESILCKNKHVPLQFSK